MRLAIPLFLLATLACTAQTASLAGIVNAYAAVVELEPCGQWLRLDSSAPFSAGDRVLLIQMSGAVLDAVESPVAGRVVDPATAGHYEFTTLESLGGDTVFLRERLVRDYDVGGRLQLVRVPRLVDARVDAPVVAQKWNGRTGGVVAVEVTGRLTLGAMVSADASGFRGGWVFYPMHLGTCNEMRYLLRPSTGDGAAKGSGIGFLDSAYAGGRAVQANGGGGGNETNAGGGGGGNGGKGGNGGDQWSGCGRIPIGGIGGESIVSVLDSLRIVMGGGGGGGHGNDWQETGGADGGGCVIVRAHELDGAGHSISATGGNGLPSGHDGSGGGGAGGTVVLDIDDLVSPLTIDVRGGRGGDVAGPLLCHGPGGGGGGGVLMLSQRQVPFGLDVRLDGGPSGRATFQDLECTGTAYGATDGETGAVRTSVPIVESHTHPRLMLPRLEAAPGDSVGLSVRIDRRFDPAFRQLDSVLFTVATPRMLFHTDIRGLSGPTATTLEQAFTTMHLPIAGATDTLAIIGGYALLGDTGSAPLEFADVEYGPVIPALSCPVQLLFDNGQLDVTTCEEGGERRVRMAEPTLIRAVSPNPSAGHALCELSLSEDGPTRLELIDPLGDVRTILDATMRAGEHAVRIDLEGASSGRYLVRLVTRTERAERVIIVVR
jgi:hypothetical protein